MKSIHGFLFLLIGMISLMAFGATSEPTQKQKVAIDCVSHDYITPNVAVMAVDYQSNPIASLPVVSLRSDAFINFETVVQPLAVIKDVGWQLSLKPEDYKWDKYQALSKSNLLNKGPNFYRCACCSKCG